MGLYTAVLVLHNFEIIVRSSRGASVIALLRPFFLLLSLEGGGKGGWGVATFPVIVVSRDASSRRLRWRDG